MRRMLAMAFGVLLGGGLVFAAFQYHLVRTKDKFLLVRRQQLDWHDAYADVRGWTSREWSAHRELGRNLVAAGHGELLGRSGAGNFFQDLFGGFRDNALFNRGSARGSPRE